MWTLQELRNGISKVNQTFEQTVDWDFEKSKSFCRNKDFKSNPSFYTLNKSDYIYVLLELICCSRHILNKK